MNVLTYILVAVLIVHLGGFMLLPLIDYVLGIVEGVFEDDK